MFSISTTTKYCENFEKIENYVEAALSPKTYVIHHRLETHNSDGEPRQEPLSKEELIALDMYYNRPPEELIFLEDSEHRHLHIVHQGSATREKLSIAAKRGNSGQFQPRHTVWNKGLRLSDETKSKISKTVQATCNNAAWKKAHSERIKNSKKWQEAMKNRPSRKGTHWYNNGEKSIRTFVCPIGYKPGRIKIIKNKIH